MTDDETLDYSDIRSAAVKTLAEEANCEILAADDTTLQLDLDDEKDLKFFFRQYERLRYLAGLGEYKILKSRNGNTHVLVTLNSGKPVEERILLQALLGSDRVRETLSLMRSRQGDEMPILLLRPIDNEKEAP